MNTSKLLIAALLATLSGNVMADAEKIDYSLTQNAALEFEKYTELRQVDMSTLTTQAPAPELKGITALKPIASKRGGGNHE